MKRWIITVIALALFVSNSFANDQEKLLGEWTGGGIRNIVGEGHERIISISKGDANFEITFKTVFYGNVNKKAPAPKGSSLGPFRIKKLTSNWLIYVKDGGEYHTTYRLNESGLLEWGALVSDDNKKWSYAKEVPFSLGGNKVLVNSGTAQWTFKTDPFKTPVGEAGVQGLLANHAYYIYEKLPSYETGGLPQRSIRVMTINEDGSLSEQFRMIWNQCGGPYFKGTFSGGKNLRSLNTNVLRRVSDRGR